jgi:hypothetical protein
LIRVSASAFDVVWADLGLARPPDPLFLHSVGATEAERGTIRETVYANLAERGLYDGRDLDATLVERLELLSSAEVYVECEALIGMDDETPLRAVAASRGAKAVLAAQPGRTIGLSGVSAGDLFPSVVGLLPELRPGPGFGVSLPASVLGSDIDDPLFSGSAAKHSAAHERQLREVLAIQARPVAGAGQFTVRVRGAGGKLRNIGGLSWFTTDVGSYAGSVTPGRRGEEWMSIAPVDRVRLAERLSALLDD